MNRLLCIALYGLYEGKTQKIHVHSMIRMTPELKIE